MLQIWASAPAIKSCSQHQSAVSVLLWLAKSHTGRKPSSELRAESGIFIAPYPGLFQRLVDSVALLLPHVPPDAWEKTELLCFLLFLHPPSFFFVFWCFELRLIWVHRLAVLLSKHNIVSLDKLLLSFSFCYFLLTYSRALSVMALQELLLWIAQEFKSVVVFFLTQI